VAILSRNPAPCRDVRPRFVESRSGGATMKTHIPRGFSTLRTSILAMIALGALGGTCLGWWPLGSWGQGGWFPPIPLRSPDLDRLPHFSLFPPVYYSHPIRHPYGYSPFARLPELTSFLAVRSEGPVTVRNPFTGLAPTHPSEESPTFGPLVVRNPFFERAEKTGLDKPEEIATLTTPSK